MARKTLAQQLAEAANPQPVDYDPEDLENNDVSQSENSDSEVDNDERTSHYVDVGRSKLRDDGIALSEGKYKGAPISRDQIEGSESEDFSGSDDEDEESDEGEESEEDSDAESKAPRSDVQQILNAEQKSLLSKLSSSQDTDAQKGRAVTAQMDIYEKLLDMRIQVQKIIGYTTKQTATDSIESAEPLYPLISAVQKLRGQLSKTDVEPQTDSLQDLVDSNEKLDNELRNRRENVLGKWSRKVELSSGRNALQSQRFRSLGQSAALQVNSVLTDMDRLVKRTSTDRSNYELPPSAQQWLFDDTDFYRLMLKDLVDRRMADSNSNLKFRAAVTKNKKKVDTKASKGRKLRYTVIDKIQGFDAPRNVFSWSEKQADDLYAGLLGVKISMDDNENENEGDANEEEPEIGDFNLFG